MGSFVVNIHVRTDDCESVGRLLHEIDCRRIWIAGPHDDWVTIWEEQASEQNTDLIQEICRHVSRAMETTVIAFLVHDSDIFCYWLYEFGQLKDEYNSAPGYWGEDVDEESLAGNRSILVKYCRPGTAIAQLDEILAQWTQEDLSQGRMPDFVFAEDRLRALAPLLGLSEHCANVDFRDIGRDIQPAELGARWYGSGDSPAGEETEAEDPFNAAEPQLRLHVPGSPLLEAVQQNDLNAIEQLVADGADLNEIPAGYTVTPLAMAASQSLPATVLRLIELGADLHKKGREGATPLRMAVQSNQAENIRVLVEHGADIHEFDRHLGTLLHLAVVNPSQETVQALLDLGIDPSQTNSAGFTPLGMLQMQLMATRQALAAVPEQARGILKVHLEKLDALEKLLGSKQ